MYLEAPSDTRGFGFLRTSRLFPTFPSLNFAPVTSTIRGVPSEVLLNEEGGMKSPCAVNLRQVPLIYVQLHLVHLICLCSALRL